MAYSGGFFGGLSQGLGEQQAANLEQKKQDFTEQRDHQQQVQRQIDATIQQIGEIAKSATAAGKDPKEVYNNPAVQTLVQSAQQLAQSIGQDPTRVGAMAQLVTMQSAPKQDAAYSVVHSTDNLGNKYPSHVFDATSGTVKPIQGGKVPASAPMAGQPNLSPSETISPGQVAAANPGGIPPAVDQPPVRVASAPSATATDAPGPEIPIQSPRTKALLASGQTTPQQLDFMAEQYLLGNEKILQGIRGKNGAEFRAAIQSRAAELALGRNMSPGDVNANTATYAANKATLGKLIVSKNTIEAFENTAIKNGDILVDLAKKVDKTGVPLVEKWLRSGRQATGDADVAQFNTQMQLYRAEVAKILTNPNLSGVLTDSARAEIASAIQDGASWQQISKVHNLLKGDFQRRSDAISEQIDTVTKSFSGKKETPKPAASATKDDPLGLR